MPDSASIGVGASDYRGDANLGGGSFGFVKLDTKPLEDLARYTMLYNKANFDQRQKDAEAAADEIADMTSYDLTSGITKDAKLLQEKYDKLTAYVRDNPNALDYRNKKEWAEYKKMRNDLDNDLKGAKVRNTMWALRQKEIQDETDTDKRKLMQAELDEEISATDIRTPIKHSQQYADTQIKLPTAPELTFDVTKMGPNNVIIRDYSVFNVPKAQANSGMFALGLDDVADINTPQGQRDAISRKKNFWIQGADVYNSVINAVDAQGQPVNKVKSVDAAGNVTYTLDESKLSRVPRNMVSLAKDYNRYISEFKDDIQKGNLTDKVGNKISFGEGALDENDYIEINYQDGISPEELALIAQYAQWKGDTYKTKVQETDDALQASAQAVTMRGQNLDLISAREGRAESARQFNVSNPKGTDDGNTQTTGNAFDEIGVSEDVSFGKRFGKDGGTISNGYVKDRKGNLLTGNVTISASELPAGMLGALKSSGITIEDMETEVKITSRGGEIQSVSIEGVGIINRQNMENAQKKFDTESKGQERTKWGRKVEKASSDKKETAEERAIRIANEK